MAKRIFKMKWLLTPNIGGSNKPPVTIDTDHGSTENSFSVEEYDRLGALH